MKQNIPLKVMILFNLSIENYIQEESLQYIFIFTFFVIGFFLCH